MRWSRRDRAVTVQALIHYGWIREKLRNRKFASLTFVKLRPPWDRRVYPCQLFRLASKLLGERWMTTIGQKSLAAGFCLAIALGVPAVATAQQQAPHTQVQKDAPAQQTAPAQPAPGMGHGMIRDGMDHSKMGRKGMEGDHGKMGGRMHQGESDSTKDAPATTGTSPSTNSNTAPPTGSK